MAAELSNWTSIQSGIRNAIHRTNDGKLHAPEDGWDLESRVKHKPVSSESVKSLERGV